MCLYLLPEGHLCAQPSLAAATCPEWRAAERKRKQKQRQLPPELVHLCLRAAHVLTHQTSNHLRVMGIQSTFKDTLKPKHGFECL